MATVNARMRQLVGPTAAWAANDLVLGDGEIGIEQLADKSVRIKVGDGARAFSALPYLDKNIVPASVTSSAGAADAGKLVALDTTGKISSTMVVLPKVSSSAGAADAGKLVALDAAGKISATMISLPGAMVLKGAIDPSAPAPAGAVAGDFYLVNPAGTTDASFGAAGGVAVVEGDALIMTATGWDIIEGGVHATQYVKKSGDTMVGPLKLPIGTPSAPSLARSGDDNTGISFPADDTVAVVTKGIERIRVDLEGRLGVGITPSDWRAAYEVFQVGNASLQGPAGASGSVVMGGNFYTDAAGDDRYIANSYAKKISCDSAGFTFFVAPAGNAGDVVVWKNVLNVSDFGYIYVPETFNNTTANSGNLFIGTNGGFYRSTSARKYKTDIEPLAEEWADKIFDMVPVHYRSLSANDDPSYGYYGFISDDVANIDPRYVHFKAIKGTDGKTVGLVPEGLQYERLTVPLFFHVKRHREKIRKLETETESLKDEIRTMKTVIEVLKARLDAAGL